MEVPDAIECPVCSAETPLDGDEKAGDTVFCSYCKVELILEVEADTLKALSIDDI